MRKLLFTYLCFFLLCDASAQQIEKRLILFGDAGEINKQQGDLLAEASSLILAGKTQVYFLGDNIYPQGMGLTSTEAEETAAILESQYTHFRRQGVPVTFVAGNHDWDKSGKQGLDKIKAQANFIDSQNDALLRLVPEAGTGGPVVQPLSNHVLALLYDSEYWLFPYHANVDSAINGRTRQLFLDQVHRTAAENKDKILLVISHHPMQSYGEHSVKFSWKDHVFPLTRKWKKAYVPLPVIGSVYPILRSTLLKTAEDLKHPLYRTLVHDMKQALADHHQVVYISGHDHGLQYIDEPNFKQIVSGSGSKTSFIGNDRSLKFKHNEQGFALVDCFDDGALAVTFYIYSEQKVKEAFQQTIYPN